MKIGFPTLLLLAAGWISVLAGQLSANDAMSNRILWIDPSSMPIARGKATLSIGMLQWSNGIYSGDYKIKATPYFFKSQKGTVAIVVSEASLARMAERKAQEVIGTAITSSKGTKNTYIDAVATPVDIKSWNAQIVVRSPDRKNGFRNKLSLCSKTHGRIRNRNDCKK